MEDSQTEQPKPKKRTIEEVEAHLQNIKVRTAEVQLQRAEMELEQTEASVAQFKNEQAAKSLRNRQRQAQLKIDINEKARSARGCTHKQGGSFKNPYGGKGPSALQLVVMPDERELIMCAICPLRVFSPFPGDGSRRRREGESQAAADRRVEKYEKDLAEFEALRTETQNKLTEEAAAPMHCGKTFKFLDGDNNQVQVHAPCDSYAQGLDNRKGVRQ